MHKRMNKAEFIDRFDTALREGHIFAYYQPQFNHSSGRMIGAEALMRWIDPEFGLQFPSDFIPVLEEQDFLFRADVQMVDHICRFQRYCLDYNLPMIPISFNMSRNDIYKHDYVDRVEEVRSKYDIPVRYLRVELTETSAVGGMQLVTSVIDRFHEFGYIVEMDDFGSGYSSLNILKDLDVDIIKLDMKFLDGDIGGRGGIIIKSIVQMTKWLKIPVIAEGVENISQADFMQSIGCNYIQGYLYSKPVPESEFLELLTKTKHEPNISPETLFEAFDTEKFWDPESVETLLFNNLVGGAAIFSYEDGNIDIIRVNKKYIDTISMNLTEKEIVDAQLWKMMDDENKKIYEDTIKRAIESMSEENCDTWRSFYSKCCGPDKICIRTFMRVLGKAANQYIIYGLVQNITAEKNNFIALADSEKRFRYASEHSNTFAWEYTIETKEMKPCFRCMRDLGLPPLLKNYPEPSIENGIFPPDYADMYRDWHRQLAEGVESLEAMIPLTKERIPFIVKYTTEFDEEGRPVKAYGSATMVPEDCQKKHGMP